MPKDLKNVYPGSGEPIQPQEVAGIIINAKKVNCPLMDKQTYPFKDEILTQEVALWNAKEAAIWDNWKNVNQNSEER